MIQVKEWDPEKRIMTIEVNGQLTQSTAPADLFTESDWMAWLASVVQPLADDIIKSKEFDPKGFLEMDDLSANEKILKPEQIDKLAALDPKKP